MILNLYKPVGWTSFDVVKKIRNVTREKKVGHGGTLDPFAEGLLIIGTGKDTKKLALISSDVKQYRGELKLGLETDTLDPEGKTISEKPVRSLTQDEIQTIMGGFVGEQDQIPPMYSAKKIDGVRLYKLARKNVTVERKPVKIQISEFKCLGYKNNTVEFSVTCSKGTYVRVLGKDLASALGTCGHLTRLIRTQIGSVNVNEAKTIDDFIKQWKSSAL